MSSAPSHGKRFTLYLTPEGPNPWKVAIILNELNLTYHSIFIVLKTRAHKQLPYTNLNPNGRLPVLIDHSNNDFTIWESGAIMLYVIGKYDTENKISFKDFDTTAIANQYLMFQVSGQGPYFGQMLWFTHFNPEKIPSVIDRYHNEIKRVMGVLENILEGKEYLVGGKASYADLAFVTWTWELDIFKEVEGWQAEFPGVAAWHKRLEERESVKIVRKGMEEAMKANP